jgi:hypothetical protein
VRGVGGAVPGDVSEMALLDIVTKSPYATRYPGAQAGQTVYYRACWVNRHNEAGPGSDLASGTIVG